MKMLIVGLGFSGRAIAERLRGEGVEVVGTSRSGSDGTIAFGPDQPLPDGVWEGVTHLLVTAPPDERGDPLLQSSSLQSVGLPALQWIGYLSTTGVYGDWQGAWVDESSPTRATSVRSRQRVAAEQAWLATGQPVHIFRLGGIYGRDRSPLDQLRAGKAHRIDKPGQVFGRIHVEDVAGLVAASIVRPQPGAIYNGVDDEPAPPAEVVAYGAQLLGIEPPPLIGWEQAQTILSPMALSFYQDNKRVSNRRTKEQLGYQFRYPSYREGLKSLL